ncbi:MAG: acetyl-CoA carboxylase biotin carboxyl carrier protein subunit [Candidatus Krumholzibacteria bacterium]|nr:acetyl-CoA carboxylase biotin carboxyl carrier protein subunit [Candidatus Krumholzibacteria bacterium]
MQPTRQPDGDEPLVPFIVDDTSYETRLTRKARERRLWARPNHKHIKTQIPGLIVSVLVRPGQQVRRGQGVIVLEAMKMRNELQSPYDGTVKQVLVAAGQTVPKDTILIELA